MAQVPPTIQAVQYRAAFDLAFQTSPIILQGGIVAQSQQGLAPITQFTSTALGPDVRYLTLPGGTIVSQTAAMFPFANQAIAANDTIQQPLTVSLVMIAPVNKSGGYLSKNQGINALAQNLSNHNTAGGTYIVITPGFTYNNVLLLQMTDITPHTNGQQPQSEWQLDFIQPILTLQGAQAQQSRLMQLLTGGQKIPGVPSYSGNPGQGAGLPGNAAALAGLQQALSLVNAVV
jgi:hypothetical protein